MLLRIAPKFDSYIRFQKPQTFTAHNISYYPTLEENDPKPNAISDSQRQISINKEFDKELSSLNDIHCPICSIKMLNEDSYLKMLKKCRKAATPEKVINLFSENKDYIHRQYLPVVRVAEHIYKKNPAISQEEFYTALKLKSQTQMNEKLNNLILNLNKDLETTELNENDTEIIKEFKKKIIEIKEGPDIEKMDYNDYKVLLTETFSEMENPKKWTLYNHAKNGIKTTSICNSLYIIEETDSKEKTPMRLFLEKMMAGSKSNIISMNKKISKLDDNFNKLLVCGNCENSRFNLIKINEYIPEFQDNFAKYINDLNQAYLEKKMTYCSGYPMQVTGMVNKVTNSKIKINASPVSKAMKTELWKLNDVKFVINDYEGVPCACCGQVTITHEQKMKILAEMENATDFQELRLIMEKNKKIIRPKFLPIVNNFQEILMKNPLISDSKMMDRLRTETRKEVRDALAETLNKIRNATLKSDLNLFDRELVNEYLSEVPISFKEQKSEEQFKHKYGEIMSKTLCKVVSSKRQVLINIANKDLNSVYTMRAKLYPPTELIKNWNSEVLAVFEGIIKSSIATKDHLQSKHMKGPDKIQNLATLCKDCNKEKGDDYFDVWYKKHPEFKVNYPKYLKKVKEILKENYHPEYKDYISENIQQIYYISHHELDFRAPIKSE